MVLLVALNVVYITQASNTVSCVLEQYSQPIRPTLGLPNPSNPGQYTFQMLEYGQQPSFFTFSKPDIVTPTVSLPDFLADYSRNENYTHNAYHQFDSSRLPLDAKVWLPEGEGPFPLVLLTHGNSEPGFDYLGELLASRGYIVAQIDQTYLNGMWGENGARGWILLEHLNLWRQWNQEPGHPIYQKADMKRVALIGMSRGGEAVALAAGFNQWSKLPSNDKPLNFNFSIKAVIGLAPMDGQYVHADGANVIKNVNYLVLQGGHDADVYQYLGSRQWQRTHFDDDKDHIKQLIYIYRANHINFNQSMSGGFHWGQRGDFDAKLITPSQQEQLTKVFVSAFLEASVFNRLEYRALLQHPLTSEFGLPEDIFISRYITSNFELIENFENDLDKVNLLKETTHNSRLAIPATVVTEHLRNGTETSNHVLDLRLEKGSETHVRIKLSKPDLYSYVNDGRFNLQFSLARADSGESAACAQYNLLTEAKVEILVDSIVVHSETLDPAGTVSPLLLSDYSQLENDQLRYAATEPVLQTYTVPIQLRGLAEKPINIDNLIELDFIFAPKQDVHIILDDIGFTP